ncbi:MAG: hypothetical protein F6K34_01205 [Okeania sp. SIO4D6]|uniref:KilA-N domain-containing protein n=1 Tax=unclassified Okeania TaxID=2634635 RepID=UPI0013B6AA9B|nr:MULTISPECIES: KilA-N domain-containing protein [unclassified Okeania]NEP03546.1 hypothetical protein [Okeania sp. SIO4D6]NEP75713.1 hypothetical protein [Okeania sp. SIO2G5]NEP96590.1 hypothetical protein [Okeania sp. SIO2F5]
MNKPRTLAEINFERCGIRTRIENDILWISLTDIAKLFGKLVGHWNAIRSNNLYLKKLELELGHPVIKVYNSRHGTWAIKEVATIFYDWAYEPKASSIASGQLYVYADNGNNAYRIGFTTNNRQKHKLVLANHPFLKLVKLYRNVRIEFKQMLLPKLIKYRIYDNDEWYHQEEEIMIIIENEYKIYIATINN